MRFKWVAFASALIGAAGVLAVGCGLDDSAITQLGSADNVDGSIFDAGGASEASTNDDSGPGCTAKTCASYPEDCHGALPDGCGKTIDCSGACPSPQACVPDAGAGADAGFFCNGPPVCQDAGAPGGNCETLTNPGNGLTTDCGNCTNAGYTCASNRCGCGGLVCGPSCCVGGTPNCNTTNDTCCKLKTCAADYTGTCSATNDNACGGNLDCTANCTTSGTACAPDHVCDTTPVCNNMGQPGGNCGTLTSTHGLNTDCGTCATSGFTCTTNICKCGSATSCGGGQVCFSNGCCTPESTGTTCSNVCGSAVSNNCGQSVDCGACNTGDICKSATGCTCGGSTCSSGDKCCDFGAGHFCHGGGSCT